MKTALLAVLAACLAVLTSAQVGYIPTSTCPQAISASLQGLTADYNVYGQAYLSGSIVITNSGMSNMRLAVNGTVISFFNTVPVAPIFAVADCPLPYVPMNPVEGQLGQITCSVTVLLPTSGPAASPSVWTSAMGSVKFAGGSSCSTPSTPITPQPPAPGPLVMGRKLRMTAQCPLIIFTTVTASASYLSNGQSIVSGSVTVRNAGAVAAPIQGVAVTLFNTVPVAPLSVAHVDCLGQEVPAFGALKCLFTQALPSSGPAANAAAWNKAQAVVTLTNGADCKAASTNIQQPLLLDVVGSAGGN